MVPRPEYRLVITNSDYYVFDPQLIFCAFNASANKEGVKAFVKEFFSTKDKNENQREIKELAEGWLQTAQYDGLYFDY